MTNEEVEQILAMQNRALKHLQTQITMNDNTIELLNDDYERLDKKVAKMNKSIATLEIAALELNRQIVLDQMTPDKIIEGR